MLQLDKKADIRTHLWLGPSNSPGFGCDSNGILHPSFARVYQEHRKWRLRVLSFQVCFDDSSRRPEQGAFGFLLSWNMLLKITKNTLPPSNQEVHKLLLQPGTGICSPKNGF